MYNYTYIKDRICLGSNWALPEVLWCIASVFMAFWIASYPDGSWRSFSSGDRFFHKLGPDTWFQNRLDACGGPGTAQAHLARLNHLAYLGGGPDIVVRGLAKVAQSHADDYSRDWRTNFSDEALHLLYYLRGAPADSYSLTVEEFRPSSHNELLINCWTHEFKKVARRVYDTSAIQDARLKKISKGDRLFIGDWGGVAGDVPMCCHDDIGKWRWHNDCETADDLPGLLSDDSDSDIEMDIEKIEPDGDPMMSDSEDHEVLKPSQATARDVLHDWGLPLDANDIPVLLLPEPIAFLIYSGQWRHVVVLAHWHAQLVNRLGQCLFKNKVPQADYGGLHFMMRLCLGRRSLLESLLKS